MKRIKTIVFALMLITALVFSSNRASAYVPYICKWSGTYPINVTYKWGDRLTGTSIIKTGYQDSLATWNTAQMRIRFSQSSSSANVLNSYTVTSSTEYGFNDITYYSKTLLYANFSAYVNAGNPNITLSNVARSVAGHELGHSMSLGEGNKADSLMNQGRDRTEIYMPRQDDLDGVNTIYN